MKPGRWPPVSRVISRPALKPPCSKPPLVRRHLQPSFRRKLFWVLYGLALFIFLMFFFGQYLLFFAESQTEQRVNFGGVTVPTQSLITLFRKVLTLDAKAQMYLNLFWYQGYMVMVVLALAAGAAGLAVADPRFSRSDFNVAQNWVSAAPLLAHW